MLPAYEGNVRPFRLNIDHDTPLLLPPDLRDWVSPDHMGHFVMDAVKALDLSLAHINERGTGHAQ